MKDFSRDKGTYAITLTGNHSGNTYCIVEVTKRDEQGNVLAHKPNVLSYPRTVEEGQARIDSWKRIDSSQLIERFEAWDKEFDSWKTALTLKHS